MKFEPRAELVSVEFQKQDPSGILLPVVEVRI